MEREIKHYILQMIIAVVAKNYFNEDELQSLGHIVSAYLNLVQDMTKRHIPMTMKGWAKQLDIFL